MFGGMLSRGNLKTEASNEEFWSIFRPKYGRFFVIGTLNGGGGRRLPPPPLDPPLTYKDGPHTVRINIFVMAI